MKRNLILITLLFCQIYALAQLQSNPVSSSTQAGLNEAEAHIAINPSDSNQMAVGYMEQNNGLNFKIYYSTDAGNTWTQSSFDAPTLSNPSYPGLPALGGGDIIMAYDKTGKLYTSWIYLYYNQLTDSAFFTGFWASSLDNGQTFQFEGTNASDRFFSEGVLINQIQNIANFKDGVSDRQWMAIDHSNGPHANKLYLGCVNYTATFGGLKVRSKAQNASSFGPFATAVAGNYQLSNVAVDQNGVLHYSFAQIAPPFGIFHASSSDGGITFTNVHPVGTSQNPFPAAPHYVNDRENAAPSLAIDGANNLHITWTDFAPNQAPKAFYARSVDGGLTWSAPLDVNTALGLDGFFINVSAAGNKVSLSTYGLDNTKKSDYYLMVSDDNGQNFNAPFKLTNQQSDFGSFATTNFAGDYNSSARNDCSTYSVWADLSGGGQPKLFLSKFTDCGIALGYQEITTINSPYQLVSLYPNPATDNINIEIKSKINQEIEIGVYTVEGKKITSRQSQVIKGNNKISNDITSLSKGNYLFVLTDNAGNKISRLFTK